MIAPTFDQWLADRNIDCQSLTPELRASLLTQWTNELRAAEPPDHAIVVLASDRCQWPVRAVREAVMP